MGGLVRFSTGSSTSLPSVDSLKLQWQPQPAREEFPNSEMMATVPIKDLDLSVIECEFMAAIAGPRCSKHGVLKLVSRLDGSYEENEQRIASMLQALIEESKNLAKAHPSGIAELLGDE